MPTIWVCGKAGCTFESRSTREAVDHERRNVGHKCYLEMMRFDGLFATALQ